MTDKKITVATLSDHPLSPSGVGSQTKYMIEALLRTGKFRFVCLGGAIKHENYQPQKTEEWGDDWIIYPIDGYGTPEAIRALLYDVKPDILWFMTDPRFYGWLWEIENEIRANIPMVYYHVWDNIPYPHFNKRFYDSNDHVACISKLTYDIVQTVSPDVDSSRIQHAVNTQTFAKTDERQAEAQKFRQDHLSQKDRDPNRCLFFWNNRNARRKQSGTLIWWFKEFLDEIGHENATLMMHTDPKDVHGQDLVQIVEELGITDGQVLFSREKVPPEYLSVIYNAADCTINISDAEGFGLATLESLACETPIIVNMTGGLQEQVTDGETFFGVGIEPASKAIIGSQEVPYIYEDRLNKEDFLKSLRKIYELSSEERAELGRLGREHVLKNYNFEDFNKNWVETMTRIHEEHGSWETRKNYTHYTFSEVG